MLRFVMLLIVTFATAGAFGAEMSVQRVDVNGKPWLSFVLNGQIEEGDNLRFAALFKSNDRVGSVELNSPGGNLKAALGIGEIIHDEMMLTVLRPHADCSSACVFILQSGASRIVYPGATIGLHRPKFPSVAFAALGPDGARKKYNEAIEGLRAFWDLMGGSNEAFELMMKTPSDKMVTIGYAEANRLGLEGDDPSVDEYDRARAATAASIPLFADLAPKRR